MSKNFLFFLNLLIKKFIYKYNLILFNMKKIIRRVGDSIGIIFNKEESKIYQLEKNQVIEIIIKEVAENVN